MSALQPLESGWWRPLPREERQWMILIVIAAIVMSIVTVVWLGVGRQNVPVASYKVSGEEFEKQVQAFQKQFEIASGEVRVPPGKDAYLLARMWSFTPKLRLKAGNTYTIWLSAKDVLHGFSITGQNINIMAVPGHAYGIKLTPTQAGQYLIVCNEYCGLGHSSMMGTIIVEE